MQRALCLRVAGGLQQDLLQAVAHPGIEVGADHLHRTRIGFGAQQFAESRRNAAGTRRSSFQSTLLTAPTSAIPLCTYVAMFNSLRANTYPTLSRPGTSQTPARICGDRPWFSRVITGTR